MSISTPFHLMPKIKQQKQEKIKGVGNECKTNGLEMEYSDMLGFINSRRQPILQARPYPTDAGLDPARLGAADRWKE